MLEKLIVSFFVGLVLTPSAFAQLPPQPQTVDHLPLPKSHELQDAIVKLSPVRFLPGHTVYIFVGLKEKVQRLFKPSAKDKAHFDTVLSGKRIKEAYLLAEKKDYKRARKAIERYGKRMDSLEKSLSSAQNQGQDVVTTVDLLADHLGKHQDLMAQILAIVPPEEKGAFKSAFKTPNEKLIEVIALLQKGRPDQAQRFFTRYSVASESAKP